MYSHGLFFSIIMLRKDNDIYWLFDVIKVVLLCLAAHIVCLQRYPVVMSTYLGIMGRVLLQNSTFFSSLLTQMASECNQEVSLSLVSVFCLITLKAENKSYKDLFERGIGLF